MQNRTSKELFDLVKSMTKWEKKSFNRYAKRNSNSESLKVLAIFRSINSMEKYDEKLFTRKMRGVQCRQLSSLKVYLYNQILDSLRVYKKDESILLQLHQLMEHANILYNKGFVVQTVKVLKRLKKLATSYYQVSFQFQVVVMEKKIELAYGNCERQKIYSLNKEMAYCNQQLMMIGHLSNQSMLLYGIYKRCGMVSNKNAENDVDVIFNACSQVDEASLTFYPRLYFLQAKVYYHLLKNQTSLFFESSVAWVSHFTENPGMMVLEQSQFQRGISYLNEAALQIRDKAILNHTLVILRAESDPFYKYLAELNLCLFEKRFDSSLIAEVYQYAKSLHNPQRLLKLCFKAAQYCLDGNAYERTLDFTILGLNQKSDARIDWQYRLRLMQLKAHQNLDNFSITDSLALSARRFAKTHHLLLND